MSQTNLTLAKPVSIVLMLVEVSHNHKPPPVKKIKWKYDCTTVFNKYANPSLTFYDVISKG